MRTNRKMPTPMFVALAVAAAGLSGCDSEKPLPPEADEVVNSCEDVPAGAAFASDESFTKFVEAEAAGRVTSEDCRAPVLTSPSAATLDRNTPPTFEFTPTQPACAQTMAPAPAVKPGGPPACPRRPRGTWARIWKMLSPIGVAEAHCPAVEGPNYLLRIRDAQDKPIYTALLSVTIFTPRQTVWKRVMAGHGGQAVKLTLARAMFVRGGIMEGPFVSTKPINMTVTQ
jgi:hypothetical protein